MSNFVEPFKNRQEAGKALALAIKESDLEDSVLLAVPRGGVVVAYETAAELKVPLDVIVPRKIRAPGQPELAIGAVASWGGSPRILDDRALLHLRVSGDYLENEISRQLSEVDRRLLAYRGTIEPPDVSGRSVVVIDDGIATGHTITAAAASLRGLRAARLTLAVPVGPADSVEAARSYYDRVICLKTPHPFTAVGYWYIDFDQVSDNEVIRLLKRANKHAESSGNA